jgi:hypothetical protein
MTGCVVVAGVEQADPSVERRLDRGDRLRLVCRAVEVGHTHAAQAERPNARAGGAELTCDHEVILVVANANTEDGICQPDRSHFRLVGWETTKN